MERIQCPAMGGGLHLLKLRPFYENLVSFITITVWIWQMQLQEWHVWETWIKILCYGKNTKLLTLEYVTRFKKRKEHPSTDNHY